MATTNSNETAPNVDQWALDDELGKEYARRSAMRGGKTIHQLVAESNARRAPWRVSPGRRGRKP